MLVVKRATSLYNSFCRNVARQVSCFLLPVFPNLNNEWNQRTQPDHNCHSKPDNAGFDGPSITYPKHSVGARAV